MDSFYTSPELAQVLVHFVKRKRISSIADFCVGDGELLRAAENRWRKAVLFATDISQQAIHNLKKAHANWQVAQCDFISKESKLNCSLLKNLIVDLVLLNPPFSCQASKKYQTILDNKSYTCSAAMYFLVESLKYIKSTGAIFAILPCSVAFSEKDKKIWSKLVNSYSLKVLQQPQKKHFSNCSPNILLVSLNVNGHKCILPKISRIKHGIKNIEIFRGRVAVNKLKHLPKGQYSFVHSTNLKNNQIIMKMPLVSKPGSEVMGPAILLPRVGNIRKEKIATLSSKQYAILSDCVIALKVSKMTDAKKLQKLIMENWNIFYSLYQGTGAKYITIAKFKKIFGL